MYWDDYIKALWNTSVNVLLRFSIILCLLTISASYGIDAWKTYKNYKLMYDVQEAYQKSIISYDCSKAPSI